MQINKNNPFIYSNDNKRYHTLHYHMEKLFSTRVEKAAVDAGFTCPNIDGTAGVGGCSFCLNGSGEFTPCSTLSITKQLALEQERIRIKYPQALLIAYFQCHTNTYAPCSVLKEKFLEALSFPDVVGLSIGTRPDCINEENAHLLSNLSKHSYVTVELGLQTIHDKTAVQMNRGYSFETFCKAFYMLKQHHIRTCVHIINGLYNETQEDMVETARVLGRMKPDAVKIHSLHILKGTQAEKHYLQGKITTMRKDIYIDTVCKQLAVLPPECVVERLTGDGPKDKLISPMWSKDKISILAGIDKELFLRSSFQGELYQTEC